MSQLPNFSAFSDDSAHPGRRRSASVSRRESVASIPAELMPFPAFTVDVDAFDSYPAIPDYTPAQGNRRLAFGVKRAIDIVGALAGLVLCCLAYVIYASRIRNETGGTVFFKQVRVGRNGRLFKCYKFRSMKVDAELGQAAMQNRSQTGCAFIKVKDDPRITPTGKILRRRYIDELPQFLNVLKGDMSLVGPRPSQPVEVEKYYQPQFRRLSVKPGLTGLFQIHGHSAVANFDEVVRLDCEYIDNWSLMLDAKILFKTVAVLARGTGW